MTVVLAGEDGPVGEFSVNIGGEVPTSRRFTCQSISTMKHGVSGPAEWGPGGAPRWVTEDLAVSGRDSKRRVQFPGLQHKRNAPGDGDIRPARYA